MAFGCYGVCMLFTFVSTAIATSRKSLTFQNDVDDPSFSGGMLRREEQDTAETKTNAVKADRTDSQRDLLGSRYVPPPPAYPPPVTSEMQVEEQSLPSWYHNGMMPNHKTDLKFEYQSSIGRDGYEPDPLRPNSEFFGPFRIDYKKHTLFLENWNMDINSKLDRGGMGNLIVGLNHTYDRARNSVILGDSNSVVGSYGLVTGQYNEVSARGGVITGGANNLVKAPFASIAGGTRNNATAIFSSVRGGEQNAATGDFSVIGGGYKNRASGKHSTVAAGSGNEVKGDVSSVNGGLNNTIHEWNSSATIQGGKEEGKVPVTGPPSVAVETAESTVDPEGLLTNCGSPACVEEHVETAEYNAAGRSHHAGHDHSMGGGAPEIRRRRSAVAITPSGVPQGPK